MKTMRTMKMKKVKTMKKEANQFKNSQIVNQWENLLQTYDKYEFINEIIECWKREELNGYKQIKN